MRTIWRSLARPFVIGPLVVLCAASAVGALALRERPAAVRTPISVPYDEPEFVFRARAIAPPTPTPPRPKPKPRLAPRPAPRPAGPSLAAFRGLGTWVDLYDYQALTPETAAADMAAHGVRTLYLQTARWDKPAANDRAALFADPAMVERWVVAAHASGMRIVGWYLPAYDDLARDVARTTAIAAYRTGGGEAFDALAVDIEYKDQVSSLAAWNADVAEHLRRVRRAVGVRYPVAAIVPAPLAMQIRPQNWVGFPWQALAQQANLFMPMAYWSFRDDCSSDPSHCAYGYTKGNVEQVRALTGRPNLPVHVLGGVADSITTADVASFAAAEKASGCYGGSLYDYQTTQTAWWGELAKLN